MWGSLRNRCTDSLNTHAVWDRNRSQIVCLLSDCQSRQGFWGSPPPEPHKPPELYHRPTGTSFSAGAMGSLDAFIRRGGGCTVSLPSARSHESDQPSLLVGHMEKCGKRAETGGLWSGTALKRTPNTDSQLVGGPSPPPPTTFNPFQ